MLIIIGEYANMEICSFDLHHKQVFILLTSVTILPASVEMEYDTAAVACWLVGVAVSSSRMNRARQRIPLPHISASVPSALMIRIV